MWHETLTVPSMEFDTPDAALIGTAPNAGRTWEGRLCEFDTRGWSGWIVVSFCKRRVEWRSS